MFSGSDAEGAARGKSPDGGDRLAEIVRYFTIILRLKHFVDIQAAGENALPVSPKVVDGIIDYRRD
jgi:hypothetical protein